MKPIEHINTIKAWLCFYLIIHHLSLYQYHWSFHFIAGQGQLVSMLFFIISGFLLSYNYKAGSLSSLLLGRFIRIYPTFLAAITVTVFLGLMTSNYNVSFRQLLGHLINFQDLSGRYDNIWFETLDGNTPLWFVSYIWWFSIIYFFVKVNIKKDQQIFTFSISIIGLITFVFYQNTASHILLYFAIFWSGAELAQRTDGLKLLQVKDLVTIITPSLIILGLLLLLLVTNKEFVYFKYPIIEIRHFFYSILGLCTAYLIINFSEYKLPSNKFTTQLSQLSYPLLLVHYPVMIAFNPFDTSVLFLDYTLGFILSILLAKSILLINNVFFQHKRKSPSCVES